MQRLGPSGLRRYSLLNGMPHAVSCGECGARFALPDDLFERKVRGRTVTVKCKQCNAGITVDGTTADSKAADSKATDSKTADSKATDSKTADSKAIASNTAGSKAAGSKTAEAPAAKDETPTVPLASASEGTPTLPLAESKVQTHPAEGTPTVPLTASKAATVSDESDVWLISYDDNDDRELTPAQIRAALRKGEITAETIAWREGMAEWLPLSDIKELAAIIGATVTETPGGFLGTGMHVAGPEAALKAALAKQRGKRATEAPESARPLNRKLETDEEIGPFARAGAGTFDVAKEAGKGATEAEHRGTASAAEPETAPDSVEPLSLRDVELVSERPPAGRPATPKKAPQPPRRSKPQRRKPDDDVDKEPPSSGTPDLRSLTTASKPPPAGKKADTVDRADEDIFSMGPGSIAADALEPPAAFGSADLMAGPAASDTKQEGEGPTQSERQPKSAKTRKSDRAPRSSREPKSGPRSSKAKRRKRQKSAPPTSTRKTDSVKPAAKKAAEPEQRRPIFVWLIGGAAALFVVWWIWGRGSAPQQSATASVQAPAELAPAATAEPVPNQTAEPTPSSTEQPKDLDEEAEGKAAAENPETKKPSGSEKSREGAKPDEGKKPDESKKPDEGNKPDEPPPAPEDPDKEVALAPRFNKSAAAAALASAAAQASGCRKAGDPSGTARVVVTFAPSGRATSAVVTGKPFQGTATGGCIAVTMRSARVPAFSGERVTVGKTITVN